ncbi:hypothetical protein DNTS_029139 [Danionella cerebrum]|uniref:Uncharacterized protein n=1 Tax=Danionella cerebrum TaxID=2873325 RepID=A0A553MRT9_9TELE|nr:hypothetical protein DNTS_029139 [Danionella translucida]
MCSEKPPCNVKEEKRRWGEDEKDEILQRRLKTRIGFHLCRQAVAGAAGRERRSEAKRRHAAPLQRRNPQTAVQQTSCLPEASLKGSERERDPTYLSSGGPVTALLIVSSPSARAKNFNPNTRIGRSSVRIEDALQTSAL